jgi:hypothetical protein
MQHWCARRGATGTLAADELGRGGPAQLRRGVSEQCPTVATKFPLCLDHSLASWSCRDDVSRDQPAAEGCVEGARECEGIVVMVSTVDSDDHGTIVLAWAWRCVCRRGLGVVGERR